MLHVALAFALGHRPGSQKSGTGHRDAVTFTPFGKYRIKTMGWGRASPFTTWHGLRPSGFGIGGTTGRLATRGRIKQLIAYFFFVDLAAGADVVELALRREEKRPPANK